MTTIAASTPEPSSFALTLSRPSASTWNVTRMRAAPATIGGIPRSSKRASERHSDTSSRSPCTTCTAIAVWPSLKVVKSCAFAVGIVELRSITRSTSPPMVSRPSDSGVTSSSSRSPLEALPASALAWIAAPSATTSSGFRLVSGGLPNSLAIASRTAGIRVEPPTITTPCTSSADTLASRSTRFSRRSVVAVSSDVATSNSLRSTSRSCTTPSTSKLTLTSSMPLSASLACRAAVSTRRRSRGVSASSAFRPARRSSALARRWS